VERSLNSIDNVGSSTKIGGTERKIDNGITRFSTGSFCPIHIGKNVGL
jgi:hypothetical protein